MSLLFRALAPRARVCVSGHVDNQRRLVLLQTDFPELELWAGGKVRDIYRVDNERLLFVATDRISAFDYVLASGIPQ